MRFVHMADMHFDTPFTSLSSKGNIGSKRRLEQRNVFKKIIDYVKLNNIPYLFICGDLYDHLYIRKTTIDFINNSFKSIPETKIFIVPGNHDPLLKNSYYNNYDWTDNVYILGPDINLYEFDDIDVYGFGFDDFYDNRNVAKNIKIKNRDKLNVLLMHADLNMVDSQYNPVSEKLLTSLGFDYIALGHIHKRNTFSKNIAYPGSTFSLGFDELGEHGILDVNLSKQNLEINFKKMDTTIFEELNLDISTCKVNEELIERLNSLSLEQHKLYKINLIGTRTFEINTNEILKLIDNKVILKIKDLTQTNININKILEQNNLKSFFVKELLSKQVDDNISEEDIKKAIELGLQALQN